MPVLNVPLLGFLKKFYDHLFGEKTSKNDVKRHERRYHARHWVNVPELLQLTHPEKGKFNVINLAYKGALLEGIAGVTLSDLKLPSEFELTAFGIAEPFTVYKAEQRSDGWVVQFDHTKTGSIQRLGPFVEALRCGNSAVSLPVDPSKIIDPDRVRIRFIGDGPFDLLIEKTKSGDIAFFMATLRRGAKYDSLTWNFGHIQTQTSIDGQGVAARMAQTSEVDKKLVWTCAIACLGIKDPDGPSCARLLMNYLCKA